MSRMAVIGVAVTLLSAGVEVVLAVAVAPAWSPDGVSPFHLAFLAGPLVFAALLITRRRHHPARTRFLCRVALVAAVPGILVLALDYARLLQEAPGQHASHHHPLIIPLAQWVLILAVWVVLAVQEAQEKRARRAAAKNA